MPLPCLSPTQRSQRPPPELKKPRFQIIPDKFVLEPYQSQMVTLQGCSPVYVEHACNWCNLYCASSSDLLCMLSTRTHSNIHLRHPPLPCSSLFSLLTFLTPPLSLLLPLSSPQVVNERLLCHSIIGRNPHKERIMSVDVSARFIAPLLMFSAQEILFSVQQVRY